MCTSTKTFAPSVLKMSLDSLKMKGIITAKSLKSGKDFTYRIKQKEFNGKVYTHVSVETEYLNFKYLGSYFNGKLYHKKQVVSTPSALGIAWILDKVTHNQFEVVENQVTLMHTGNCVRCGRTLTDATSIELGIGPTCRGE